MEPELNICYEEAAIGSFFINMSKGDFMPNILSKPDIAKTLFQLLEQTSFGRQQTENYINRLFESFKWEGVPYVESEDRKSVV